MADKDYRLVLLETSGNQAYIFGTNKLRDIIGASELTFRAGTYFLEEAIKSVFPEHRWDYKKYSNAPHDEPPIGTESGGTPTPYEVLLASSGKALILVDGPNDARRLITEWSRILHSSAPGIDALGVFTRSKVDLTRDYDSKAGTYDERYPDSKTPQKPIDIANAVTEAHELFEKARVDRAAVQARFQALPVFQPCSHSGLPATKMIPEDFLDPSTSLPVSLVSAKKVEARKAFIPRLQDLLKRHQDLDVGLKDGADLTNATGDLSEYLDDLIKQISESRWLAVIHADGNGLGQVFMEFHKHADQGNGFSRSYVDNYRKFSSKLDRATQRAFLRAIKDADIKPIEVRNTKDDSMYVLPIVPIVLGGDDMTVVMPGDKAIPFTKAYLDAFAEECQQTEKDEQTSFISRQAEIALGKGIKCFGMAAGVCIVKPHFPFFAAYDFAEELVRNAKYVKNVSKASSAIDFHIMYDSSASSIKEIRDRLSVRTKNGMHRLTTKPYVTKPVMPAASFKSWASFHAWSRLENAVEFLKEKGKDGRRKLPNSQAHAVRGWLFKEQTATIESEWKILTGEARCKNLESWKKTFENVKDSDPGKLFQSCDIDGHCTVFLDALESMEFFQEERTEHASEQPSKGAR